MSIFHHTGKPAIIAQKLQRVACNKLHMKPRHNVTDQPIDRSVCIVSVRSKLTEATVGDVADPVVALARKIPSFQRVIAPNHGVVAASSKPRVGR